VLGVAATNTGTGTLGAGTVMDPGAWVADTYTIRFLTPSSYEVRDSANTVVASGAFAPSQSVTFAGVSVQIDGTPAAGDTFTAAPSAQRDVFATLDLLISQIGAEGADPAGRAQIHSEVGQRLLDIDNAISRLVSTRGEVGARVRALDQQESLNEEFEVHLRTTLSSVRDLDYAEALSRLSQELFGLDAAQQAFARAQNLSLFKYI
jgi:flagellar hook-associated protein 3 FlgL